MKNAELDLKILSIIIKPDGTWNPSKAKITHFLLYYKGLLDYMENRFNDLNVVENFREIIFRLSKNIEDRPKCPVCGNAVLFDYRRYKTFCNDPSCRKTEKGKQLMNEKTKQTSLLRYGVESPAASEESKISHRKTSLEKYGVDHPAKTKEIASKISNSLLNRSEEEKQRSVNKTKSTKFLRYNDSSYVNSNKAKQTRLEKYGDPNYCNIEKAMQTCLERYGVDNYAKTLLWKEKTLQTCLERYGVEYVTQTENLKEKSKQTMLNKFGVEHPLLSNEIKEKTKKACLDKYNADSPLGSAEIREKIKTSLISKYGVDNPSKSEVIKDSIRQTCLEKYGVDNPLKSEDIRDKCKKTCLDRYGVENPMQNTEIIGRMWETKKQRGTCNISTIEKEIADYFSNSNVVFFQNYNSDYRYPFHVDFYFPGADLFVEIQGLWTHGGHPYNPESLDDKIVLEQWKSKNSKYYDGAIKVWTITDPLKRQIAKSNDLKYLEIFTCDFKEAILKINEKLREIL